MNFDSWEPTYLKILDDFGFSREEDEIAALILSGMLGQCQTEDKPNGIPVLASLIYGKDILVCGNASILADELDMIDTGDYVIITADGATAVLFDRGVVSNIIVTDLDGDVEKEIAANKKGALVVVHAHGDNIDKIMKYVPHLSGVIGSTQAAPLDNVYNFGGFTDGDRCVFLANEFGAASITLVGFDFDDVNVSDMKRKKLKWAKLLINTI
ncbi:MAG: 6-hydroxymethylpterin diphosphokinase MptE-like protein [Methanosarcinaceae archaeon]